MRELPKHDACYMAMTSTIAAATTPVATAAPILTDSFGEVSGHAITAPAAKPPKWPHRLTPGEISE